MAPFPERGLHAATTDVTPDRQMRVALSKVLGQKTLVFQSAHAALQQYSPTSSTGVLNNCGMLGGAIPDIAPAHHTRSKTPRQSCAL